MVNAKQSSRCVKNSCRIQGCHKRQKRACRVSEARNGAGDIGNRLG
jgi:hypothetical protein